MNNIKNNKNKKAFTLAEICIACGVFLALLVPVLTLLSRGSSGTILNRNQILAQTYISNVIAFYNAVPFDDDNMKETEGDETKPIKDQLEFNQYGIKIEVPEELSSLVKQKTVQIKDFTNEEMPYKYKLITAKIEWLQPGEAKSREVTMTSLVTQR